MKGIVWQQSFAWCEKRIQTSLVCPSRFGLGLGIECLAIGIGVSRPAYSKINALGRNLRTLQSSHSRSRRIHQDSEIIALKKNGYRIPQSLCIRDAALILPFTSPQHVFLFSFQARMAWNHLFLESGSCELTGDCSFLSGTPAGLAGPSVKLSQVCENNFEPRRVHWDGVKGRHILNLFRIKMIVLQGCHRTPWSDSLHVVFCSNQGSHHYCPLVGSGITMNHIISIAVWNHLGLGLGHAVWAFSVASVIW